MIERVISAFGNLGFDLDDTEIADILWLSVQMRQSQSSPLSQSQRKNSQDNSNSSEQNQNSRESSPKGKSGADIYSQLSQDSDQISGGLPIKVPAAQALRNKLAISRSLKPLKRRIPSKSEFILDETATAERIAQEKLLLPVMRPAPERWLELALIIDEGASMMLWKQTIKEFKQLLERHGAFRDVRTWGLFISEDSKVWLRSRTASVSRQKKLHHPRELIDPNGRRLFVIISDCVSPAWRNGTITKALAAWAKTSPTTIIQVLPEWLWERSALGIADSILLRSLAPGVPNQQLIMTALDLLDESDVVNKLKVPVVTLEPESLRNWAWMVAGAGDIQTKGFLLAPDAEVFDIDDESIENTSVELSAKQRLQRFRLTASPMARKLAGLLAATPISLPVVRLIRQTMLPQSSQVHVAEVFLGGILKPLSPIDEGVDADKIQYDFVDGVRDLLLDGVPLTKSTEVLREVSEYVAQRAGLSVDEFTAMLVDPSLAVDSSMDIVVRPFAQITAKVLKRLGGEYAQFAEQIEKSLEDTDFSDKPSDLNTNNTDLTSKTNTDGVETLNSLSRYWKMWRINPAAEKSVYEQIPLTIAKEFINNQLSNVENTTVESDLFSFLLSSFKGENPHLDIINRAIAGLCLRCYVSEAILKEYKRIDSSSSDEKQFTYRDFLPFVLDDDGQKLIILDEDGKTQLLVNKNGRTRESWYNLFTVTVLQTFSPEVQSPMSLDNWAYLQTQNHVEQQEFLHDSLQATLSQAIKQQIEANIQKLQKSKKYAPFAQKYVRGLQLYYENGMSLKEIAPELGMTSSDQERRILNPGELLLKVRSRTVEQMLESIVKLAAEKGLTEIPPEVNYTVSLTEQIESYVDGEIFQEAAEEIRAGKNLTMNSAYAKAIRDYISDFLREPDIDKNSTVY